MISQRKIYIAKSIIPNAGRGVFANETVRKSELIESCPVIEVSLKDPANNDRGLLVDYFFYFGKGLAIALGFGSIYNHSYDPNATYKTRKIGKTIDFIAIKNIKKGEEITVNYNFGKTNDKSAPTVRGVPVYRK
jgi:uncharacterized protein